MDDVASWHDRVDLLCRNLGHLVLMLLLFCVTLGMTFTAILISEASGGVYASSLDEGLMMLQLERSCESESVAQY